jgi:murein DD-endopeptidase MepM/ murein hydrolase activator NlpD
MRWPAAAALLLLSAAPLARAQDVKQVGATTITVDRRSAYPGGLMVVRLRNPRISAGACSVILDGRRVAFQNGPDGTRALVPVPLGTPAGERTLGVEVRARGGIQRVALRVGVSERSYRPRSVMLPLDKRALLLRPDRVRDGRQLLQLLHTLTTEQLWRGSFRPPQDGAPVYSFGSPETWDVAGPVNSLMDSCFGEQHRGLDYPAPVGTPVLAPAAGSVLFAGNLTLTGETLLIDHGQGLISAFFHLGRIDAWVGQQVEPRAVVAASGDSGLAYAPHVHWGLYLHASAIDPQILEQFDSRDAGR